MATQEQKTVAFVLYPGLTLLDLVGPLQVFASLRRFSDQYRPVVVAERLEPMPTDGPLTVTAGQTFADVPDPAVVIVPGGDAPTIKAMGDPAIREYLRQAADTAPVVGSVCTGALVLAAAGLLEGRQATTHWAYHRLLERLGATYLPQRWVEDGKFITSAGVSAGIDMALTLVARLTDEPTARRVQLSIEYDPHPPFGGIDWDQVNRDIYEPIRVPSAQRAHHPYIAVALLMQFSTFRQAIARPGKGEVDVGSLVSSHRPGRCRACRSRDRVADRPRRVPWSSADWVAQAIRARS